MATYTVSQAAIELGISEWAVRRRMRVREIGKNKGYWWRLTESDMLVLKEEIPSGWHGHKDQRIRSVQSSIKTKVQTKVQPVETEEPDYIDSTEA